MKLWPPRSWCLTSAGQQALYPQVQNANIPYASCHLFSLSLNTVPRGDLHPPHHHCPSGVKYPPLYMKGPFDHEGYRGDLGARAAVALSGAAAGAELGNHSNSITASILLLLTRLSSSSASSGAAAAALAGARAQQPRLQPAACRPLPALSPSHSTATVPAALHGGE